MAEISEEATLHRSSRGSPDIRMLHVITGLGSGGAERILSLTAEQLHKDGCQVRIVALTPGGAFRDMLEAEGVPVEDIGITGLASAPAGLLLLARIIRSYKPTHVHSWMYHGDLAATVGLLLSGRRKATYFSWSLRCSDLNLRQYSRSLRVVVYLCRLLSGVPDIVVANSESGLKYHLNFGYRPRASAVLPNGVNTHRFSPDAIVRSQLRREWNVADEVTLVVFSARVDPAKDHATFLSAIAQLENCKAVLLGHGTEIYANAPNVIAVGERNDVERILAACDIAVSSSLTEGFPNAILEAMSCGLPVIATDVGDSRQIVDGVGEIVPPGDVDALTKALQTLVHKPAELRRELGQRTRDRAISVYSADRYYRRFLELHYFAK